MIVTMPIEPCFRRPGSTLPAGELLREALQLDRQCRQLKVRIGVSQRLLNEECCREPA